MRSILILSLLALTFATYGQTVTDSSEVKVVFVDKSHQHKEPAWFINGKFIGNQFTTLNPEMLEDVSVVKKDSVISGITYYGQVHLKTKREYNPQLITLTALKAKYTKFGNQPVVFMIDGNIVNADYDSYVVDENYILQIVIDGIKNPKENIDLGLIKLLTKTEENIKRSKEIKIKGAGNMLNK